MVGHLSTQPPVNCSKQSAGLVATALSLIMTSPGQVCLGHERPLEFGPPRGLPMLLGWWSFIFPPQIAELLRMLFQEEATPKATLSFLVDG